MNGRSTERLVRLLMDGERTGAVGEAETLVGSGITREEIVSCGLEVAMKGLESKCTLEEFNLLEIMIAGRAVMDVIKFLYPAGTNLPSTKGTVVIATPEGDVHDLGKNILRFVLVADGYRLVDCGCDCPVATLADTADEEGARAVCVSGLITSVIPVVRQIRGSLAARGLDGVGIIAGGAALKQAAPEDLDVDFVCDSAFDAANWLDATGEGGA
ncbi:MAG TPA: cobalamin-binding protein [Methanoregulaceae archaeon]|nr:cobalamin-binding protein [Methanoregulaceae archaeon]